MTYLEQVTIFEQQRASRDWPFWISGPAAPCECGGTKFERIGDGDTWQCEQCKACR